MRGAESTNANRSKVEFGGSADETSALGTSAEDDANWFARAAQRLLGNTKGEKAGFALYVTTGLRFDQSTCDRYAAGRVRPTAYFLRALLRTSCGWQFLAALMDGSDEPWWSEVLRAKRIAAAVDPIYSRVEQPGSSRGS